jgi:hypothetical protein
LGRAGVHDGAVNGILADLVWSCYNCVRERERACKDQKKRQGRVSKRKPRLWKEEDEED